MIRLFSDELLECLRLLPRILDWTDRSESSFGNRRTSDHFRHGQDMLLDLRDEAQQSHNLSDTRPGEAFAAGDGGLAFHFAYVELPTPFTV